jgi:glycosyltransferase involved in cell wall biosynthesis
MPTHSSTHLVLIPSYKPGPKVYDTVKAAREYWTPVWVVIDGSTDGTAEGLTTLAQSDAGLRILIRPYNGGKGAAVLDGMVAARAQGFTHILTMDSDGQHPAPSIPDFMAASQKDPRALVLGDPVFDASAPSLRVKGRKISNWWANVETLWQGIHDSLFGFRVYPIEPLMKVMQGRPWMRRFDFDVEAAVRLCWRGLPVINIRAPVRYFRPDEGGVSHFNYWRDNTLLTWMHARLFAGFLVRIPLLIARRVSGR